MSGEILGVALLSNIQIKFISHISAAMASVQATSIEIFYILTALELSLFGLAWMIRQDEVFGILVLKVFKIGLFFVFITYFPALVQSIVASFIQIAEHIVPKEVSTFIYNPGKVWEIGLNSGVSLLKLSVEYGTYNFGMSLIYIILGFGILILFGMIGAQIIVLVVGFYMISVIGLILLPFGIIKPMEDFFYKVAKQIFKIGVKLFTIIVVIGVGLEVWQSFGAKAFTESTNLSEPLALFFTTFVIAILSYKMPTLVSNLVGDIGGDIFAGMGHPDSSSVSVQSSATLSASNNGISSTVASGSNLHTGAASIASATNVSPNISLSTQTSNAPSVNVSNNSTGSSSSIFGNNDKSKSSSSSASINVYSSSDIATKPKANTSATVALKDD